METEIKYYPLTNSQEATVKGSKYSLHKSMMQLPFIFRSRSGIDFGAMRKAIDEEIRRNDSLRMVFTERDKNFYQYMNDEVTVDVIPYDQTKAPYDFTGKTAEEEMAELKAEAVKQMPLFDGTFGKFVFFKGHDGKDGILFVISHYNADAYGAFITVLDLFKVYNAIKNNTEMPKPLGSWKDILENELKYTEEDKKADIAALSEYYDAKGQWDYSSLFDASRSTNKKLIKQNKSKTSTMMSNLKSMFEDEGNCEKYNISAERAAAIEQFCRENMVSMQNFFSMMMRTYTSKINGGRETEVTNSLTNRRATKAQKNCGGCMMAFNILCTVIPASSTIGEAFANIDENQRPLYRHSNFSCMELAQFLTGRYNHSFFQHSGNITFSLFMIPKETFDSLDGDFEWVATGFAPNPCYLYMIPQSNGSYDLYFNYRTKYLDPEQIKFTYDGFMQIIDNIIKLGTGATVQQLLDSIKL